LKYLNVDVIQVSIDGISQEKHEFIRGQNTFSKVYTIFETGLHSKHNIIPMYTINKFNYRDIKSFINLMIKFDVSTIGFERYIPVYEKFKNELLLNPNMLQDAYKDIYSFENSDSIYIHVNDPLYNVYKIQQSSTIEEVILSNLSVLQLGCSALRTSIYIDTKGNVMPCTFVNKILFNLKDNDIRNIKHFLCKNNEIENELCQLCKYNTVCRGCRAAALLENKNWKGNDPMCFVH
jgi:radical SAM protein with 4Fe4S-binding SPASM domain